MKADLQTSSQLGTSSSRLSPLLLLLVCLLLPQIASAQTVEFKETNTILQTKVHLRLGETTLVKTLAEVSRQTGLQIQAADYLQERELLVDLDNMSAQSVLDTLAEGNDWIWYEARQGQIFVARPKFNKTQELLNVAPAFRAIVPKDLRRFVGMDRSEADIRSAFRQSQPNSQIVLARPGSIDHLPGHDVLLPKMLYATIEDQNLQIISWVTEEVKKGKKTSYTHMTPEQRQTLLNLFVLKAMHTTVTPGTGVPLLIRGLNPAGVDENQMRIMYKDNSIFVGLLRGGKFSYGEGIMSAHDLPDPLWLHTPL